MRPLARRNLSTLRPDAVALRARNPLVRARLRRVPLNVHPIDLPPATITSAPRPGVWRGANARADNAPGVAATDARNAIFGARCARVKHADDDGSADAMADIVNADMMMMMIMRRVIDSTLDHASMNVARADRRPPSAMASPSSSFAIVVVRHRRPDVAPIGWIGRGRGGACSWSSSVECIVTCFLMVRARHIVVCHPSILLSTQGRI